MVEVGWSPSPQIAFSPEKVQHHRICLILKTEYLLFLCTIVFSFFGGAGGGEGLPLFREYSYIPNFIPLLDSGIL